MRPLVVLLMCAAPAALHAEEAGFGGAPAQSPAPEASCLVQDESGAWISCDHLLEAAPEEPEETPPPRDAFPRPVFVPKEVPLPPAPDEPRKGAVEEALERAREERKPQPLSELRKAVRALAEEVEAAGRDPARAFERERRKEKLAFERAVLEEVERQAERRMRRCMREKGMKPTPPVRPYRMTPAGPVSIPPEELSTLRPVVEPYPCERVRVVDQALIDKVRHLFEVERKLREETFDYYRLDERRALEEEHARLLEELGADPLRRYRPIRDVRSLRARPRYTADRLH